jgi:Zn-finger protein
MKEERQRYEIPHLMRGAWKELKTPASVKRGDDCFWATREDAIRVILALNEAQEQRRRQAQQRGCRPT